MEVWHQRLHVFADAKVFNISAHLVASLDSISLDPTSAILVDAYLRELGLRDFVLRKWELVEFVSPYYGEDPIAESWDLRVGRAWNLKAEVTSASSVDLRLPASRQMRLPISEDIPQGHVLRPKEQLPLVALADSRSHDLCEAAAREFSRGVGIEVFRFDNYSQLRAVIDRADSLGALDDFLDLCDRYELVINWRDFLLRLA
jgi:hypothetical protein